MKDKIKLYSEESVKIMIEILIHNKTDRKNFYKYELVILKRMFSNYFKGQHYLENLKYIQKHKNKTCLEVKYKFFREVYTMANDNWLDLKNILNTIDITDKGYNFEYPGEFLCAVLAEEYQKKIGGKVLTKTHAKTLYLAIREYFNCKSKNIEQMSEKGEILIKRLKKHSDNNIELTLLDLLDVVISPSEKTRIDNFKLAIMEEKTKLLRPLF